jgi:outer membrane protein
MSTPQGRIFFFAGAVILACTLAVSQAAAQGAPPLANRTYGIATLNSQEFISGTVEGKKAMDALNQRFAPKQAAVRQQQQEIEDLERQLQAKANVISAAERQRRMNELDSKKRTLQRTQQDAEVEVQKALEQALSPIRSKMQRVLEAYVQSHGYVLVVDYSVQSSIIWFSPATDITKEVIRAYDAAPPNP